MADPVLTPALARSLVTSSAWRAYVAQVLEEFIAVERRYDLSCAPRDQGMKLGLQWALELPYQLASQDSPLTRTAVEQLRTRRRRPKAVGVPDDASFAMVLETPRPSSGLV